MSTRPGRGPLDLDAVDPTPIATCPNLVKAGNNGLEGQRSVGTRRALIQEERTLVLASCQRRIKLAREPPDIQSLQLAGNIASWDTGIDELASPDTVFRSFVNAHDLTTGRTSRLPAPRANAECDLAPCSLGVSAHTRNRLFWSQFTKLDCSTSCTPGRQRIFSTVIPVRR